MLVLLLPLLLHLNLAASEPSVSLLAPVLEEQLENEEEAEEKELIAEDGHHRERDDKPNLYDTLREQRYEERRKRALEKHSIPHYDP